MIHRLEFLQLVQEHQPLRQRELRQREPVFQLQVQALQQLEPEQVLRQLALILQLQVLHLLLLQQLF